MYYEPSHSFDEADSFVYMHDSTPPHFHRNFELLYVLEGRLFVTIDGVTETLNEGEFAMILQNQVHRASHEEPARIWVCDFPDKYVQEFARFMEDKKGTHATFRCDAAVKTYLDALFENELLAEKQYRPGVTLEMKMEALAPVEQMEQMLLLKACLCAICASYLRQVPLTTRERLNKNLSYQLLNYISEHFRENITLRETAEALGYNYSYLSRCQKQLLGVSFNHLVNHCRLEQARHLIDEDRLTLAEIAIESGFGSTRNFRRVYKETTGRNPSQAR